MKIQIETIPHKDQRYPTVGDWQFIDGVLIIKVSETGNEIINSALIIHELVEALLCKFSNPEITAEMVDAFDMTHPELEEPGDSFESPYNFQHFMASTHERLFLDILKVDRDNYENVLKGLL